MKAEVSSDSFEKKLETANYGTFLPKNISSNLGFTKWPNHSPPKISREFLTQPWYPNALRVQSAGVLNDRNFLA